MTGAVCWFSNKKGFGFIKRDDEGRDVFVHFSNVTMDGYKSLKQGQRVEFDIEQIEEKGPNAIYVKLID